MVLQDAVGSESESGGVVGGVGGVDDGALVKVSGTESGIGRCERGIVGGGVWL